MKHTLKEELPHWSRLGSRQPGALMEQVLSLPTRFTSGCLQTNFTDQFESRTFTLFSVAFLWRQAFSEGSYPLCFVFLSLMIHLIMM